MIIPVAGVILLLLPGVLGGRISRLARLRLQGGGWLAVALVAQVVALQAGAVTGSHPGLRPVLQGVHVASYLVAAWFLWMNRRIPWLWLVGVGAASNGLTIALNHGTLPARAGALQLAGIAPADGAFVNSGPVDDARLWFLGDVFAIPAGWPLANVFSVGDLVLLAGTGLCSAWICGTVWRRPWRPPATLNTTLDQALNPALNPALDQ